MSITSTVLPNATSFALGGVTAPSAPAAMMQPTPTDLATGGPSPFGGGGAAAHLFKNLETFPGQVQYTPSKMSARQEGKYARKDAVRAARHAERTSEPIRGGLDRKADMVVGPSLRVHATPDWDLLGLNDGKEGWKTKKPFAKACERVFRDWADDDRCLQDAEGHYNFGGMMWMAFRNLIGPDGECAGIIHYDEDRQKAYNARYATFVQIIDPDRIDTPPVPKDANNATVQPADYFEGKHLDKHGRMIGFWVSNKHPSEGMTATEDMGFTYVPRETTWGRAIGFHFFQKTRGGQMRGVTKLTTILRRTGQIDTFDDANVGAAIVNQVLANYIETVASAGAVAENLAPAASPLADGGIGWGQKLDYYDRAKIRIGGTRIPVMPPGDKIVMSAVNRATGDPTAFRNNFLREFASAIGISFEQLSQNFSDANYSAARAALLEVWRSVMSLRKFFTAHIAKLIYSAVIEEAIFKGKITLPAGAPPFQENRGAYTACGWTGPGMGWIDPQKEANAIKTMLEIKLKSRATASAEMDGTDYLDTFDQIEQERFEADERGFVLDPLAPGTAAEEQQGENPDDGSSTSGAKKGKSGAPKDGDGDGELDEQVK